MMPDWQIMNAVVSGTQSLRQQCATYLPQEPREDDDAYTTRVKRSVLSPFTLRLIENAAGLVLRRPITVNGDPYWQDFSKNVDGLGSSINEYNSKSTASKGDSDCGENFCSSSSSSSSYE